MRKLLVVLAIITSLLVVGCGDEAAGFDKPEDLATQLADVQNNVDTNGLLKLTYFANSRDKAKIKAYYDAVEDILKKQMEIIRKSNPNFKLTFKEQKIDGDKGQLIFTTGMGAYHPMDIIKINGKWLLNSIDKSFKDALTIDPEEAVKSMQKEFEYMQEDLENMSDENRKKMEAMSKVMQDMSEEDIKEMKDAMKNVEDMPKPE